MIIPIIVLVVVFLSIAIRQVGNIRLPIWLVMLSGAVIVLLTGQISPANALKSINIDVILFLFGMFVVGQALEESGYLAHLSYKLFSKTKSVDTLILSILFGMGILSAFLMNDTLAIIGTPVVLLLAKKHKINPKLLLLSLAFAVTIGSVMSPIGNPQNLLIAINGNITNSFIVFLKYLFLPTIINLFLAFILLKIFYKTYLNKTPLTHFLEPIEDLKLSNLCKISLSIIILLVIFKILTIILNLSFDFKLTYIALISMLPILIFSEKRIKVLKQIDWHTLVFFASMFILMQSVWNSGFFQRIITKSHINILSTDMVLTVSVLLSQLISNVPLVALYLPMLADTGATTKMLMALAAGSTIAGNLFILGAASNVIIIQNAEKKYRETLTFWEFARIGIPLTGINILVYWLFLR
ncbi:MAG: anion transporter [bacterium]|nr:anion transporter [bacterium]